MKIYYATITQYGYAHQSIFRKMWKNKNIDWLSASIKIKTALVFQQSGGVHE